MATLRNRRKLAAVSRETPDGSRSSRAQNVLDPESVQDYISQVSEEIEGRVTKKLSKEFSKTESRILGALSKLDELRLNPQVRTCSVAVAGTPRNNNSENWDTTGDRSSGDPCPKLGYFSHHSGQLISPETENHPHRFLATILKEQSSLASTEKSWGNLARTFKKLTCKNLARLERILQDLASNKFCVYILRSDNLCISPKSKHNQPLEVKFDELCSCWTYFVI